MTPIRVLQIFTIMDRGGAETMIMNYYRKLDKTKVQFDFLVHRPEKGAYDDEIETMGGIIYKLPQINPFKPKAYYKALRAFFNSHNNYKIVHSHLNTFSYFPHKIAAEFNIPCRIAHAHIAINKVSLPSIISGKESLKESLKKLVKLQLKKRIKQHATHYFSCGDKAGNWLFGKTPFKTINNAIDTEKFKYNPTISARYKKEYGLENELVIGHIGRFVSQKNHAFLIKIFAALLNKQPHATLVLIGDGPLRAGLQTEAKQLKIDHKIQFLGVRTDIPELCQMMDVFVFPSFYEGLPVTLIEAQAASLKIIASNSITNEVSLTNNIKFLSIEEPAEVWAQHILDLDASKKIDQSSFIINGNYDIISNTKQIELFYLEQNNTTHGTITR
ncbi:glycosyltransferase family 1 protein [Algibacter pectinivorans]|uniref:Glycosyltransferase involved in cell wall bisynthesis n=1 Tax=Algibacter pectinivorans TaxID=870482 RepID=A0A1I1PDE6_9FLAO|nr:glycosyltransferase family 1 protein [Algibacter pectinivorans]SFD07622.1 Glycosyltransferase involved in cell wall bisynthesis [Algibacter pectinivorans]